MRYKVIKKNFILYPLLHTFLPQSLNENTL